MAAEKNNESEKISFKDTLNLPKTDFPIRPQPLVEDAAMVERWQQEDLYEKTFNHNQGAQKFILHDGPPYANGHIHLGGAYNKILKDFIAKSQRMAGNHVPVTPGWDCHGLPIELKVTQEFKDLSGQELQKKCREYANHWIDIQRDEFKKLGILFDWDHPYLTMNYHYEADTLRAFGKLVEYGYIQKKLKTVPWCFHDQTVLASAEIEYKDRKDPSIYVTFDFSPDVVKLLFPAGVGHNVSLVIWTTTPWTLPLNRAVLIKPHTQYAVIKYQDNYLIIAASLVEQFCALLKISPNVSATIDAEQLEPFTVLHPLIDYQVPIILDQSVSLQEGTAIVHCAPGCGPQDYEVGIKHSLDIYSPITTHGTYTADIQPSALSGMSVVDGQIWVIKQLASLGKLIFKTSITHSYPHCWRCHQGLIFRATSQWFCDLSHNDLKNRALEAVRNTKFFPERSHAFLKATLENRLEWCLSRQRTWGVPITALLCKQCNYVYITPEFIEKIAQGIEQHGIEYWNTVKLEDILPATCASCGSCDFIKEKDILDVWFDSGISHYAVLYKNDKLGFPADIYAEGLDQHRGWFQSSMLTSLIIEGQPCTKSFLTHGFTVDERGHKMSKSLGNVVSPTDIIKQLGTDGLRLWVSSINYEGDIVVSAVLLRNIGEVYRKIRNTCRFLLSNLYDFDKNKDVIDYQNLMLLEQYALQQLFIFNATVRDCYQRNDFTGVFHALADFCAVQLSSTYLDIIKDRLYVEKSDGYARRSAQTACWYILDTITKLIAPILSFTAEQISDYYQSDKKSSIHLQQFPDLAFIQKSIDISLQPRVKQGEAYSAGEKIKTLTHFDDAIRQWNILLELRSALLKTLELEREKGLIKHSLEAHITVYINLPEQEQQLFDDIAKTLQQKSQTIEQFLKELLIVSQISLVRREDNLTATELKGLYAHVEHAAGVKCPRCWQWEVSNDQDGLCKRCQHIVRK